MNQEDILKMAREAGGYESPHYPGNLVMDAYDLDRFAALVAAKAAQDERDALCDIVDEELDSSGHALAIKLAVRARGR